MRAASDGCAVPTSPKRRCCCCAYMLLRCSPPPSLPPCSRLQHACRLPCANTSSRVASIASRKMTARLQPRRSTVASKPRLRVLQSSGAQDAQDAALGDSKSASKSVSSDVLAYACASGLPSGQKDPSRLGSRAAILVGRALVRPTQQKQAAHYLSPVKGRAISQSPLAAA